MCFYLVITHNKKWIDVELNFNGKARVKERDRENWNKRVSFTYKRGLFQDRM